VTAENGRSGALGADTGCRRARLIKARGPNRLDAEIDLPMSGRRICSGCPVFWNCGCDHSAMAKRSRRSNAWRREVLLVEVRRGRSLTQARRTVGWTIRAYETERHRHPTWANAVTAARHHLQWRGWVPEIDGRAIRGELQRSRFLELARVWATPSEAYRAMEWPAAAYWQSRRRHPDFARRVDQVFSD